VTGHPYSRPVNLIDTRELAKLADRKPRTILAWRQSGRLRDQATIGRIPVWDRADAALWLQVGAPHGHRFPDLDLSDWHTVDGVALLLRSTVELVRYHRDHDQFPQADMRVGRHRLWHTSTVAAWAADMWPKPWLAEQRARLDAIDRLTDGAAE
jgi:hypothetical protein